MIESLTIDSDYYPPLLRHIQNPPLLLYVRGNKEILTKDCLSVVGTRRHTEYGKRSAQDLVSSMARAGFAIVSGLALGIDALAHQTALDEHAPTIAVLGSGLSDAVMYPPQNRKLAKRILDEGGAIISEFPADQRAQLWTFPQRNRIISGMSKGVLVIEGDMKSGTMITAREAADQGRDVFAVPGPIYASKSQGTNYLIQKGAKLVTCSQDILEAYGIFESPDAKIVPSNDQELAILSALAEEPLTMDELIRATKLEASLAASTLTIMEIEKKVRDLGNGKFVVYS